MTTNHKFVLSVATIAILSGTGALAADTQTQTNPTEVELKVDSNKLKLGNDEITITAEGVANVSATKDQSPIIIKNKIDNKIGNNTLKELKISATESELKIGEKNQTNQVSIGGTAPNGKTASTDGYGFDFSVKTLTTEGKKGATTELNVNEDSSIKTTQGTTLGTNSAINIASNKTLTISGALNAEGGSVKLGGGILTLNDGLNAKSNKLKISAGGTINFNGGNSNIGGKLATTNNKGTNFNVKQNASVDFEDLDLKAKSKLTLNGGTVNIGALTTAEATNLELKSGTLNFNGKTNDDGTTAQVVSTIAGLTLGADSTAVLNFNDNSSVSIESDLDLSNTKAQVNFNDGSLVKIGKNSTGELKIAQKLALGGQLNLGKLSISQTSGQDTQIQVASIEFNGKEGDTASVSLSGVLLGTNAQGSTNPAKFSIKAGQGENLIGASGESISIGEGTTASTLTLNLGTITTKGELKTASAGTLIFDGGSLSLAGESDTKKAKLSIDDATTGLKFTQSAQSATSATLAIGNYAEMIIGKGIVDLSNAFIDIELTGSAKLATTAASKINGTGNTIKLGEVGNISIDGSISTAANGAFEAGKITGDLTLDEGTKLGISTNADENGLLKTLSIGKISTKDSANPAKFNTATLAFGTGSVKLAGEINADASGNKLDNAGFAGDLTLAKNSTLEFNSGAVSIKGRLDALATDAGTFNTLKVSGASANLGALGNNINQIELKNGDLNIKSDYKGSHLDITHIQTSQSALNSAFVVEGQAFVTNSKFAILPLVETGMTSYKVLSTTKGLIQSGNTAEFKVQRTLRAILGAYDLQKPDESIDIDLSAVVKDYALNATLKDDGKNLFLIREFKDLTSLASIERDSIQTDIDALVAMDKGSGELQELIYHLKIEKEKVQAKTNAQLAYEIGGANSDILLSAFGVSNGATDPATRNAVMLDIIETGGQGVVREIKQGASSALNFASSTASVINSLNLSNDMAIGGRIAQANNPYANLAQAFAGQDYAALPSDIPLYYANNGYANGFWANAVGGLNRVESENGFLAGLSVGFDRQLEGALLGFYLSYANANLNDKSVKQESKNIQAGVYLSLNQRDIEINAKAYGQTSITDTNAKRSQGEVSAHFIRQYAGLSANIGAILDFNNHSTFVKPFIGENYYYAHTPEYNEKGQELLLNVKSANNHALSFDVGVDVRQYYNENSFIYITPSIEQYVINSGGDYTAGFIGSDTTFTIDGKSRTKTYLQTLMGGNLSLGDRFNVNLGLGVKKILSGHNKNTDGSRKDELYLSGNLGVKYRF